MCDYSLAGMPNRLAVEGEELISHKFSTGSIGLTSPADLAVCAGTPADRKSLWERVKLFFDATRNEHSLPAVCVPPGASLILKAIPLSFQREWRVGETECVSFLQTSADANRFRDALRFQNGRTVLLQELREGMRLKVSSLGGDRAAEEQPALSIPGGSPVR